MSVDRRVASVDVGGRVSVDEDGVSVDCGWRVSIDELVLLSIDGERFSLRIERSNLVGSETKSNSSLLLLVLIGMYVPERQEKIFSK